MVSPRVVVGDEYASAFPCAVTAEPAASNADVSCVAAEPSPRLVRAVAAFARSDRFAALASLLVSAYASALPCAVTAAPDASNAEDGCVAAEPSPRFVLAVAALATSDRLPAAWSAPSAASSAALFAAFCPVPPCAVGSGAERCVDTTVGADVLPPMSPAGGVIPPPPPADVLASEYRSTAVPECSRKKLHGGSSSPPIVTETVQNQKPVWPAKAMPVLARSRSWRVPPSAFFRLPAMICAWTGTLGWSSGTPDAYRVVLMLNSAVPLSGFPEPSSNVPVICVYDKDTWSRPLVRQVPAAPVVIRGPFQLPVLHGVEQVTLSGDTALYRYVVVVVDHLGTAAPTGAPAHAGCSAAAAAVRVHHPRMRCRTGRHPPGGGRHRPGTVAYALREPLRHGEPDAPEHQRRGMGLELRFRRCFRSLRERRPGRRRGGDL